MKNIRLFVIALIIPFAIACEKDDVVTSIQLSPTLSSVPCTGGTVDLKIITDFPWRVEIDTLNLVELSVSKNAGIGDDIITVSVPPSVSYTSETVRVKIFAKGQNTSNYKYAVITQLPKPYIALNTPVVSVPREGGVVTVVVTANQEWKATCSDSHVSIAPVEEALGVSTVKIKVPASTAKNTIKVVFKSSDASAELVINQQ